MWLDLQDFYESGLSLTGSVMEVSGGGSVRLLTVVQVIPTGRSDWDKSELTGFMTFVVQVDNTSCVK